MKINKKETKIMCNEIARKHQRKRVVIDGEELEEVNEYKYLCKILTSGKVISKEIYQRITSGLRHFGEYRIFILIYLKRKIKDAIVLPAMTYGAET